jgi:hypothetical protein
VGVLHQNQNRKIVPRFDAMRNIGDYFGFILLQQTEEVRKTVVRFRVNERGEEP